MQKIARHSHQELFFKIGVLQLQSKYLLNIYEGADYRSATLLKINFSNIFQDVIYKFISLICITIILILLFSLLPSASGSCSTNRTYSKIIMLEQLSRESCSNGYNNFEQLSKYQGLCCHLA